VSKGCVGVADSECEGNGVCEGEGVGDTLWVSQFIRYLCKGNIRPLVA
jgi:hypothetical protein